MQQIQPPRAYAELHKEQIAFMQEDIRIMERAVAALRVHDGDRYNQEMDAAEQHDRQKADLLKRITDEIDRVSDKSE